MIFNIKLDRNFTAQFNKMKTEYGEEFAKLNGLSEEHLSGTDFLNQFVQLDTVADSSIDGNSNVSSKDIVTFVKEMSKPNQKLLAYNKIYQQIQKQHGFNTANQWFEQEWNKGLYMHDASTASFVPYCYAYDIKRLAEEGLFFLENYNSKPPKHLGTFIQFVKEFINFTTNRTSGACGLPNLIPYMYYFWSRDVAKVEYIKTPEYYAKQGIQEFIFAVNQPYVRDGIQSAFTNTSIFDHEYLDALFGGSVFPDGCPMIDEIEDIMQFQKWFLEVMSEIRNDNMFTFPVNTVALLRKNGKFVDEEFAKWAIKHNMKWSDSNIFCDSSVNSLANCCRLKSNITDLGWSSSIGGGALSVGSIKVSTVNLARIAYEAKKNEKKYLSILADRVMLNLLALDAQRNIIKRNIEKGLLRNYGEGLINIKNQYSTIGVIGIYETLKFFGYVDIDEFGNSSYTPDGFRFGKAIFELIKTVKQEFLNEHKLDYMINIEQIPGESAAAKLQSADVLLYGKKVITDLPLYGNQFMPLGIKATAMERIKTAAEFDEYCNGGSILHWNIDAPFSNFKQAWDAVNFVADQGVTYFAFNLKISLCDENHSFFGNVCPTCGKPKTKEATRVVGFYTITDAWSKERKAEYRLRQWEDTKELKI